MVYAHARTFLRKLDEYNPLDFVIQTDLTQSAAAVEYSDCFSAEW